MAATRKSRSNTLETKLEKLISVLESPLARGALGGTADDAPLNTVQAASYLDKRPATLAVWRSQNKGPLCSYAGSSPRYRKQDLDEFIANGKKKVASPNVGRPRGKAVRG
jgi:hypothetical protein